MTRVAAVLVLLLTASTAAPVTCTGWESTPEARRACCQRAHHEHCHDQTAADNCCAGHEHGRLATVTPAGSAAGLQGTATPGPTFSATLLYPAAATLYSAAVDSQLHAPPNLLVRPLRI